MTKVEIKNLYKVFGATPKKMIPLLKAGESKESVLKKHKHSIGVNNASFKVEEGEIFVVMGLSGSGKSTLIRCLNRLIDPTAGEILIDGENIADCNAERLREIRRKKIAMVFQNFALLPHRTVAENVAFGLEIQKEDESIRLKKAAEMLAVVGLKGYENSYPSQLSGGMQQRVGLARALATSPDVLLMDEAFSALDPLIRKGMQNELLNLQRRMKKTIIFITHDLDEALKLGDRIAIMKDGVIVQIGTPEEILSHPANDYVSKFVQGVNRSKVLTASSIMREADTVTTVTGGARVALHQMREEEISSVYVTDKQGNLLGLVTIDDVTRLIREGKEDLASILEKDFCTVGPDVLIEDISPLFLKTKYPVAVVDSENVLLGLIFKVSVLAGIVGEVNGND
ncbi:MAG: glycine betaine/L-proline ABC transporter ATP-binding protein [Clostridium sp.]|uniref:quaternary amine ABC transporter ATP-binding protein n=1 Tax=Clostridium sp. TaxID=1506 RepID=UPI0029091DA7|nr:glycine betaine/L-proline ABC transporter ATP-binding protein [Clostridium sp.]MDU7339277.1 glycine betaine/L-proline ABC transporter ATP-binding protein [Clostridium sp.]